MSSQPPVQKLELNATRNFAPWLMEQNASLVVSTYQSGMLFMIGVKPDGTLSYFNRMVARAMGIAASAQTVWVGTMYQVWRFENTLEPGKEHQGFDGYYMPRVAYSTGDIDCHDIGMRADGSPVFVNTLYSCLATVDDRNSFRSVWVPPFITRLAPEDRCHLNGLAMVDEEPKYVTCISRSDAPGGWRDFRNDGGLVLEVPSGEVVCSGLSMPHSPRWYRGKLWLHNSGTGHFGFVDFASGKFEPVAFCPGYLRGLSFVNGYAVVGLSAGRDKSQSGLKLEDNLREKGAVGRCAVQVIDLERGDVLHEIRILGDVKELYDTAVLPGIRVPGTVGFMSEEIWNRINFVDPLASK